MLSPISTTWHLLCCHVLQRPRTLKGTRKSSYFRTGTTSRKPKKPTGGSWLNFNAFSSRTYTNAHTQKSHVRVPGVFPLDLTSPQLPGSRVSVRAYCAHELWRISDQPAHFSWSPLLGSGLWRVGKKLYEYLLNSAVSHAGLRRNVHN